MNTMDTQEFINNLGEMQVIALTLYGEARNSFDGMIGVANVIKNRVRVGGWWGSNLRNVCLAHEQFSCWLPGLDLQDMIAVITTSKWSQEYAAALGLACTLLIPDLAPPLPDNVGPATSYYATSMRDPPRWAAGMVFQAEIGGQRFYALPQDVKV